MWHKRFTPVEHAFRYRVFMVYLDLAEIDQVLSLSRWWSTKRLSLARFRRADFFSYHGRELTTVGNNAPCIDVCVRKAVYDTAGFYPDGPVRLLTNLRYFGYIINPISCYYCFDSQDTQKLTALLIEVTNTPWGEKTHYVLDLREYSGRDRIDFNKAMHVSPFMPMNMKYRWKGGEPGETLSYTLENHSLQAASGERGKFVAGVNFEREVITGKSLNRILFHYPLMTAKVAIGIYWQALRLAIKRVRFVPHPAR